MSCISINQKPDQIIIKISENATEEEYSKELQAKIKELKKNVPRRKNTNSSYRKSAKK